MCAKSPQSRPTLCNPIDHIPMGSSVHGILLARILEWASISFSRVNEVLFGLNNSLTFLLNPTSSPSHRVNPNK